MTIYSPEHRENVIREVFEGISTSDFDKISKHIHDDVVAELPYPPAGVEPFRHGKEVFMSAIIAGDQLFKTFVLSITDLYQVPDRDTVVVEFTSSGEIVIGGPWDNRYIGVIGFRDGKINLWREYMDAPRATEQLSVFAQNPSNK